MMPATLSRTVASEPPQLAHSAVALRQCDSCPFPFRGRASTVALLRSGLLAQKQSGAKLNRAQPSDEAPE